MITPSAKDHNINILFSQDTYESSEKKGDGKPGRKRLSEGPHTLSGWRYRIKEELLRRQGGRCGQCQKRKKLRLYRTKKYTGEPIWSSYVLICQKCRTTNKEEERNRRRQKQKRKREEWLRSVVWSDEVGIQKNSFLEAIRSLVFKRDGHECPYCGSKGKETEHAGPKRLGLGALIPPSRGGPICYDNYTVICQSCRSSKGNQTALEFLWKREGYAFFLSEELDHSVTATPGGMAWINLHLVAQLAEFLHKLTVNKSLDNETKLKAERLRMRLSETPGEKATRRKAERTDVGSWLG